MGNNFKKYSLLEVYDVANGLSKSRKEFGFGYPFLSFKEVFNNYFLPNNLVNLANTTEQERKKCSIKKGDVFITRTSETFNELGMACVALKDYPEATFNGFTKRLRPNNKVHVNPEYAGFYFQSPCFRKQVLSLTTMTTRASLNNEMLGRLTIFLPDIDRQEEISKILFDCHQKVENNLSINKTLEEMAQAIFKSWFVDFDPVHVKTEAIKNGGSHDDARIAGMSVISGKTKEELASMQTESPEDYTELASTTDAFPSSFVESELGLIPEGWEMKPIGDIVKAKGGYAFKSKDFHDVGHPVIKIKNITNGGKVIIDGSQCINEEIAQKSSKFSLKDGDLIMAMTGATVCKSGIVVSYNQKLFLNQRVAKFESDKFDSSISWFLFCLFKRADVFSLLLSAAQGSAQPNISSTGIESVRTPIPPDEIIKLFCYKTNPFFSTLIENEKQNHFLIKIRDTLLPKLLSGEIEVFSHQLMENLC